MSQTKKISYADRVAMLRKYATPAENVMISELMTIAELEGHQIPVNVLFKTIQEKRMEDRCHT